MKRTLKLTVSFADAWISKAFPDTEYSKFLTKCIGLTRDRMRSKMGRKRGNKKGVKNVRETVSETPLELIVAESSDDGGVVEEDESSPYIFETQEVEVE